MSSPSSVQDRPAPSGGSAGPADEEESGSGRERNWSLTSLAVKVVALGTVVGVAFALTPTLVSQGRWGYLVALWLATVVVLAVYGTGRAVPAKYLLPGVLLLIALVVYPAVRTGQISLTNYGDGTRTTQAETVASILGSSVVQTPDAPRYNLSVGTTGTTTTGPFTFFLVPVGEDEVFRGDAEGLEEVTDDDGIAVEDGFVTEADGFELLTPVEINDAGAGLGDFTVPTEDGAIRRLGIRQAFEGRTTLEYDESSETFTDVTTGTTYTPQQRGDRQLFVSEDGQRLSQQSWLSDVGLDNYERALTNDRIRNDFIRIFLWTLAFATLSVASTFALGLGLAVVLNDPRVRGQRLYRSLLLLPYAVPGFISLLVWSSFYNRDFGLINDLTGLSVNWFGGEWTAKFAVLLTNLWMGFPYMFLVCTGRAPGDPGIPEGGGEHRTARAAGTASDGSPSRCCWSRPPRCSWPPSRSTSTTSTRSNCSPRAVRSRRTTRRPVAPTSSSATRSGSPSVPEARSWASPRRSPCCCSC